MNPSKYLKVTLIKSLNGRIQAHKASVKGLGFRKINQTRIIEATPCNLGMIHKVFYLLKITDHLHT